MFPGILDADDPTAKQEKLDRTLTIVSEIGLCKVGTNENTKGVF